METAGNWLTAAEISGSWFLVDAALALAPKQCGLSHCQDIEITSLTVTYSVHPGGLEGKFAECRVSIS